MFTRARSIFTTRRWPVRSNGNGPEPKWLTPRCGGWSAIRARRQLFEKALIVFTSDHGEGLGEHGESTHGYFIYQSTLHVPLIIHWPAGSKRTPQDRVDEAAGLLDVAPTILDVVGAPRPGEMRG